MTSRLARLFEEILRESETNPGFRTRLEAVLSNGPPQSPIQPVAETPRARNRRPRALVDPYEEYAEGEARLRGRLSPLSVEELKDIVSEHAMDSSRLALKWKSADRLIELIVATVRSRVEKGDAFRE